MVDINNNSLSVNTARNHGVSSNNRSSRVAASKALNSVSKGKSPLILILLYSEYNHRDWKCILSILSY